MLLASLQRLTAAACGRPGLGLGSPGITAALVAAASSTSSTSSSSSQCLRGYSDEAGGSGKEGEPAAGGAADEGQAAAADAEAGPAAGQEGGELTVAAAAEGEDEIDVESEEITDVPLGLIDFDNPGNTSGTAVPAELFTKRQRAWMGLESPEKYKHFLPQLSRKELGSFADDYVDEEFEIEQELYPEVPENVPLYDLRDVVPEIYQPKSDMFERIYRLKADRFPNMPIAQFVREIVGVDEPEEQPPHPGARPIIRWQICHVLSVGTNESHPANKRVKAWVYLRDLQQNEGLTDEALQYIARICGPRYNPNKGLLRLTSDRYPHREANRAQILKMLNALVEEGHRKFPPPKQQEEQPQEKAERQKQQKQQTAAAP